MRNRFAPGAGRPIRAARIAAIVAMDNGDVAGAFKSAARAAYLRRTAGRRDIRVAAARATGN